MKHLSYLSIVFSFILVVLLGYPGAIYAFIILGHGHFALAYLYMYKAGKINSKFILRFFTLGIIIFGLYYLLKPHIPHAENYLGFFITMYFIIHLALDYYFMNKIQLSFGKILLTIAPLGVVIIFTLSNYLNIPHSTSMYLLFMYPIIALISIISSRLKDFVTKQIMVFSFFLYLIVIFKVVSFSSVSLIIISHITMWYLYSYLKMNKNKTLLKKYILNVLNTNIIIALLFILTKRSENVIFTSFFQNDAFYLWTFMHFISTLRSTDFNFKRVKLANQ